MAASTPKSKSKRRSRGPGESPSARQGHQWVPLTPAQSPSCLVPGHKLDAFKQGEDVTLPPPCLTNASAPLPGGVIITGESGRSHLLAHWTPLERLNIGEHLPVRTDSVLLHPETMKGCGCVIAAPVVIKGWGRGQRQQQQEEEEEEEARYVCGKAWPLPSLPLDVVGLGWSVACGCGVSEEDTVEVWPVTMPTSQFPVASTVTLVPSQKLAFSVDSSFTSYLLHMNEGRLLTPFSILGVQYLGERRDFEVRSVQQVPDCAGDSSQDVQRRLSKLSLNGPAAEEEEEGSVGGGPFAEIYKVNARTKLVVSPEIVGTGLPGRSPCQFAPTLSDVGGLHKQTQLLRELVLHPLKSANRDGVFYPSGVLLHGPPGVGKSLLARALAAESSTHSVHLSTAQLLTQDSDSILQKAFSEAVENSPSLIILEDLDMFCPRGDAILSDSERRVLGRLLTQLDLLQKCPPFSHVTVLATTNQIDRVVPELRCQGKFEKEIEIPVPSASDRLEILEVLLKSRSHLLTREQLMSVAERAHSYVGADLFSLCSEAQYKALHRSLEGTEGGGGGGEEREEEEEERITITFEDMLAALREVRPSAMREVTLEVPKVLWSDIGGQEEVKQSMREAVERPITHPEAYVRMGIRPPRGVLLYGPPGCSKTMVARALATESGLNFMAVKGPELFSKWVGDSERAVRQLFSRARAAAPAIVFFDEIDALAVQRKNEGSSVADRVLAQLLTEMDGVESLGSVLVVAATNRPDMIDKALLRPGRFDELIYVPLPSEATRSEIFKIQFRKMPVAEGVSVEKLVSRTKGFSGAEVVSLCQKAALCAMRKDVDCTCVSWQHFEQALCTIFPQTGVETVKYYEQFKRKQKNIFNHES